jgi:hypothetical protein
MALHCRFVTLRYNATVPDDLQFERAEFVDPNAKTCALCKSIVADRYYQLAGHNVCASCAARFQHANREGNHAQLVRATLFGLGGAAAGWALYAIVSLATGMEFSLLAIACGWLVGKAMRKGSGGAGGRKFQIVAVLLTYAAITTSYVPRVIIDLRHQQAAKKSAPTEEVESPTPAKMVSAIAILVAFCLAAPFLGIASGSGILGAFIIVIGLLQAWRAMAVNKAVIVGPYSVQSN